MMWQEGAVSMQWCVAQQLPRGVREHVSAAAAGFVSAAHAEPARLPALLAGDIAQKLFQSVLTYSPFVVSF
jgi:hypothetical protein